MVRAHKLRQKMVTNLQTVQDRLTFLTTTLNMNNLSLQTVKRSKSNEDLTSKPRKSRLRRSNSFTKDDKKQSNNSSNPAIRKISEKEGLKKAGQVIKGCDGKLVETILNEVIPKGATGVSWADVSGQEKVKYS